MGKTTNILDLNNRLEKVEKEKVAQNNYNSLKNRPKINGNLLTGDKTGAQLGLAEVQDVGDLSALTTTDKSSAVAAINEVKSGLTNYISSVSYTGTTDSDGFIAGGVTTFGLPENAIPLSVYFERGNYSVLRKVNYYMFGSSGIGLQFLTDATDTPVADSSVTATIYYVIK